MEKEIFAILSFLLTVYSQGFYIWNVLKGRLKPHGFSWLLWSLLTCIGFAAQWHEEAGPGMISMGMAGLGCFIIFLLSLKYGEKDIKLSDWAAFGTGLAAIPLWLLTDNPLYSVILITAIDGIGLLPTIRKSWNNPWQESTWSFFTGGLVFLFSVAGLRNYSLVAVLYPVSIVVFNFSFVALLLARRHISGSARPSI